MSFWEKVRARQSGAGFTVERRRLGAARRGGIANASGDDTIRTWHAEPGIDPRSIFADPKERRRIPALTEADE